MILRGKYERFCQEYVIDYNGAQAAIRAGYSEKTAAQQASRLLTNVNVVERIKELQRELVGRLSITQDRIIAELWQVYTHCLEETPVLKFNPDTGHMEETGRYQFDSKSAIRALELLGKHLGMFGDKLQVSGKIDTSQLDAVLKQLRGGDSG